ncbi:polyribonucleotide nucleotidyltransferase [candidate division WOR-3 bacterium]|nr:polyribonucleotide nucleotidyltransferase [candidate division WOR-3 bacterium]
MFEVNTMIGNKPIKIETGKIALQANGAVTVQMGDTLVLVTACAEKEPKEGVDFFPLTVNYIERTYAAGKIPGGFFKREGRPSEKEILVSRLIDRPLRPLFPKEFYNDTQVIAMVLSFDGENDSDIPGIIGASVALGISDIPFGGPLGAVKIGYTDNQFIVNPSISELERSKMELVIAGTKESITMMEGRISELDEEVIYTAMEIAHREIVKVIEVEEKLIREVGKQKMPLYVEDVEIREDIVNKIIEDIKEEVEQSLSIVGKKERKEFYDMILKRESEKYEEALRPKVLNIIEDYRNRRMREKIINDDVRIDGRGPRDIRPIKSEVSVLPRAHGSALFRRGETLSLCSVTLGTKQDEQKIEELVGEGFKRFMVHYNFPPFSVGEVAYMRGPGRREIGHGALAEKALKFVIPDENEFPYTMRVVSDILESNGSSSMATVCGGSLALMDSGVPIRKHIAGIALGLIKDGEKYKILTDIAGEEDHSGDMDFKVAGTRDGITAIQLDTKIKDLNLGILKEALYQAKEARLSILSIMEKTIPEPRSSISEFAPKIAVLTVKKEKIGELIGPGGKNVRGISEKTGTKIEISDEGEVLISGDSLEAVHNAEMMVREITEDVEVGSIHKGRVMKIMPFGAFVKLGSSNKEGLVHISQLAPYKVNKVEDVVKEGDEIMVKVISVDNSGKISLSRKALLSQGDGERKERPKKSVNDREGYRRGGYNRKDNHRH